MQNETGMKKEKYPAASFAEDLEEDAPEKACISCKFRHYYEKEDHNRCLVDGHVIGYLALWCQTCRFHELESKGRRLKDD